MAQGTNDDGRAEESAPRGEGGGIQTKEGGSLPPGSGLASQVLRPPPQRGLPPPQRPRPVAESPRSPIPDPRSPPAPLIIAELGTSHGGDLAKAREMIAAAAESGAACAKFQIVYADEILHPNTGEVPLPGGPVRLHDAFRRLEAPPEFYAALKEETESRGLMFLCTPFGARSARVLRALRPSAAKIASPELNHVELLREVASWRVPVFLSSGVSRLGDIEDALDILNSAPADADPPSHVLLHCVTAYPAPEEDYNLRVLASLSAVFGVPVGVSDHSLDPELVPALAAALGAAAIEKHFCLSRDDLGLDDPIALPPPDFARMSRAALAAAAAPDDALASLRSERGGAKIDAVLGTGAKKLAPSERANYERTNRSLHALREILPGETITPGDFAALRTEKILRPGLPPSWAERIAGRTARKHIPAGEGIRFEDI